MGKKKERRAHKRYEVDSVEGELTYTFEVKILNMSLEGMAIETNKMLNIDKNYRIKLANNDDKTIEIDGQVVWSRLQKTQRLESGDVIPIYRSGIKFNRIFTKRANEIAEFIEKNRVMTLEKRILGRFRVQNDRAEIDTPLDFVVKKMSLSGMLIETYMPMKLNEHYDMTLKLDDKTRINVTGRVANVITPEDGAKTYRVGIEFKNLNTQDRESLRKYLLSLNNVE